MTAARLCCASILFHRHSASSRKNCSTIGVCPLTILTSASDCLNHAPRSISGKFCLSPDFGDPGHFEPVAYQLRRLAIAFERPDAEPFSAGLSERSQFAEFSGNLEPGFLLELTASGGEFILVQLDNALRHRPRAVVLLRPIGTAWVNQKNLRSDATAPIKKYPGAAYRHQRIFDFSLIVPPFATNVP